MKNVAIATLGASSGIGAAIASLNSRVRGNELSSLLLFYFFRSGRSRSVRQKYGPLAYPADGARQRPQKLDDPQGESLRTTINDFWKRLDIYGNNAASIR